MVYFRRLSSLVLSKKYPKMLSFVKPSNHGNNLILIWSYGQNNYQSCFMLVCVCVCVLVCNSFQYYYHSTEKKTILGPSFLFSINSKLSLVRSYCCKMFTYSWQYGIYQSTNGYVVLESILQLPLSNGAFSLSTVDLIYLHVCFSYK